MRPKETPMTYRTHVAHLAPMTEDMLVRYRFELPLPVAR
jgi:hypothetical protein